MSTQNCDHSVFFYASERDFPDALSQFFRTAVADKNPMVLIMTPEHRASFEVFMQKMGCDVRSQESAGRLFQFDAAETLDKFLCGSEINRDRFHDVVGGLLSHVCDANPNSIPWAYGEMVDLLCKRGMNETAIELEHMWNYLGKIKKFSLLCGYELDPLHACIDPDLITVAGQVHTHVHAMPGEVEHAKRIKCVLKQKIGQKGADEVWTWACSGRRHLPESHRVLLWLRQYHPSLAQSMIDTLKREADHCENVAMNS